MLMSCRSCRFSAHVMPLMPVFSSPHATHVMFQLMSCRPHVMALMPLMSLMSCRLMPKFMLAHVMSLMPRIFLMLLMSCRSCHATHASFSLMPCRSCQSCQNSCELMPKFMSAHAKIHVSSCKLMFAHVMPSSCCFSCQLMSCHSCHSCCSCGASSCHSCHEFSSCQLMSCPLMSCEFHAKFRPAHVAHALNIEFHAKLMQTTVFSCSAHAKLMREIRNPHAAHANFRIMFAHVDDIL